MLQYSLITLSHNKLACTRRCLKAMLAHTVFDGPAELIIVDNGSTDGSAEWLRDRLRADGVAAGVAVHPILNTANVGCSTARNQAIARAGGEYLVFVDNDVAPRTRDWLPRLRRAIETRPDAGLSGPKLVYPHPPHDIQCAGVGISRRGHVCFRGRGEPRDHQHYRQSEQVQCLISACLMVRSTLVSAHGGFDEVFNPVQFEDFDLCYRLRSHGWQAWYEPSAELYHYESVTTQGTPSLPNTAVVIRNGLAFQRRWRHMFEKEDGPEEHACSWRTVRIPPFDTIVDPPVV